jgi:hypothetical protein
MTEVFYVFCAIGFIMIGFAWGFDEGRKENK